MTIPLRLATLALTLGLALAPGVAAAEKCSYSVDPNGIGVIWTAFKFTEKTAVNGKFNTSVVSGPTVASSAVDLAKGLAMEIDATSVETDNPARNATISEFFFGKFKPNAKILAAVAGVAGDDQKGTLDIRITMNGVARTVPFAYTVTPDGEVVAKGSIDVLDFALKEAHDSLHHACDEQHKGKDGVSKTWTEVDLTVSGKFAKSCS